MKQLDMEQDWGWALGRWHPYYMEGAGKDENSDYSGCIKDIHSELPVSHQSQGDSRKQKCEYLKHTWN